MSTNLIIVRYFHCEEEIETERFSIPVDAFIQNKAGPPAVINCVMRLTNIKATLKWGDYVWFVSPSSTTTDTACLVFLAS